MGDLRGPFKDLSQALQKGIVQWLLAQIRERDVKFLQLLHPNDGVDELSEFVILVILLIRLDMRYEIGENREVCRLRQLS